MNVQHLFSSDETLFSFRFNLSFYLLLCLCFCLLALEFLFKSDLSAEEFPWPIGAPKRISSSFGEPRSGRFHFGIDFKSGGTTGKKVFALGDGYIIRVNTSPFGYGKGLYLKLDSGETIVYGHLSGYLPDIEDRLFKMRISKRSYDIDWWPPPNEFRVKKGQVIAYSGDTGNGPAHLHMELRDENNIPMNPLNHGVNVYDTIPPAINSIVLIPLDKHSSIDGFPLARWFDVSLDYTTPIVLNGTIGIAASCYDKVNLSNNHLGGYHLALSVDSTVVFSKTYDRLPYGSDKYSVLDYLSGDHYGGSGYLSTLFRRTGNQIDFYEGDGVLYADRLGQSERRLLTVRVEDYAHNTTKLSLPVIFKTRPMFTTCGFTEKGKLHIIGRHVSGIIDRVEIWEQHTSREWVHEHTFSVGSTICDITTELEQSGTAMYKVLLVDKNATASMPAFIQLNPLQFSENDSTALSIIPDFYHDHIVVRIESTAPLATLPGVYIERDGLIMDGFISPVPDGETAWITSLSFRQKGETRLRIKVSAYTQSLKPLWKIIPLNFTACDMTSDVTIQAPDSLFSITVRPESLYRPAPVMVDTASVKASNGLRLVSQGYRVTWGDEPLRGSYNVALELERDPPAKAALYHSGNGNGWGFFSLNYKGRVYTGKAGGSGYFAVLTDTTVPYVKPLAPSPGSTITTRKPLLKAYLEDKGSGIAGSDSIVFSIDDIPVYGEYDFEANTVSYRLHNPLKPGSHTVKITVTDRMENAQTREWKFNIKL